MTIVAEKYDYVIGIDTHSRTHTYAIINTRTGSREACQTFPVSAPGMNRAIAWIQRKTHGQCIAAVEGTRSYGGDNRPRPDRAPGSSRRGETATEKRPGRPRKIRHHRRDRRGHEPATERHYQAAAAP